MNYNFHTHTSLCSHATGTKEEYIIRALEGGIEYMGFADHIPCKYSDGYEAGYRVPEDKAMEYVEEIHFLREKYKDKIKISIGFESEYFPGYFDSMLHNAREWGAEYLILGQHFVGRDYPDSTQTIVKTEDGEYLKEYVNSVTAGMKTEFFTYVAHPDIINFKGDTDLYKEEMQKICKISKELNIPLEINFLGIRNGRHYPNSVFWELAGKEGSPVTFGFDSHSAACAYDGESLPKAKELIKKYSLNYIGMPELILINK